MFVYESHLGGYYASSVEYDDDQLYCETCNDSDLFIGEFNKISDFLNHVWLGAPMATYITRDELLDFASNFNTEKENVFVLIDMYNEIKRNWRKRRCRK